MYSGTVKFNGQGEKTYQSSYSVVDDETLCPLRWDQCSIHLHSTLDIFPKGVSSGIGEEGVDGEGKERRKGDK